jgi:hypothetical protein
MERKEGDMDPKWLLPLSHCSVDTSEVDTLPGQELDSCEALLKELESECLSSLQDAHNAGFYINEYTTKVNALGDKLLEGLRRASEKILKQEEAADPPVVADGKDALKRQERERIKAVLKKFVYLMNSLQVKSGSELVFPMLFDHLSFSTHKTWEMNMKVPYAKALSSWEQHFKGSLKALRNNSDFAMQLGFILPSRVQGPHQQLPKGWLMMPAPSMQTLNTKSMAETVQAETGESNEYLYISPKGCRFTSLKAALVHAGKQTLLDDLPKDSPPPSVSATTVEFTSNHEDYMHRGMGDILAELPAYIYNIWVYKNSKLTSANRHALHHLDIPFDASYRQGNVKIQRLSIMPRVPQIEGLFVPSPDVDPHKNALIKLLLFKPLHAEAEIDEQGNPTDPYEQLYKHRPCAGKHHKGDPDTNPYDAFVDTWRHYWKHTVLPNARAADEKLNKRMEWPSIWECTEVFLALMKLAELPPFHDPSMSEDEKLQALRSDKEVQKKLENRLSIREYCCYTIRKIATHLDAFARAKAAPKTKSYALDGDAAEDPTVHRIAENEGNESFEAAPEDMLDGDLDGHVSLKPGDAPAQVAHPLTADARLKALAFSRLKTPKLVRDMISVGLLPITSSFKELGKHIGGMFAKSATTEQLAELCEVRRLASKLPTPSNEMLDEQRSAFEVAATPPGDAQASAAPTEKTVETHAVDTAQTNPQAQWQDVVRPSVRLAARIQEFEASADDLDPKRRGFKLADEQQALCKWFGRALDVALDEEIRDVPVNKRTQSACLLIGAGGTGKTTIILQLLLPTFLEYFPELDGEDRYVVLTFSHAQGDAISNDQFRAKTAHTAVGYRVASLRNRNMGLKTKRKYLERTWKPKILAVQDEVSLFPAMVQNMLFYRSMRSRQNEHGLRPEKYGDVGELMGHIPILLIAGDFLQIKPAREISLADDLDALRRAGKRIHPEHHTAQDAILGIADVIHLTKSKRFLDEALPAVMEAVRGSRPDAPLPEEELEKLRRRKIENCQDLRTPKNRPMGRTTF